jgi:hypothetical protein
VACDDENEPKTWVKRLDDPAQKANAIKRLTQFFEDAMTKNDKNRDAPDVKALLDTIVEPLTKTYTAGNLDDKTRKDLIKFLADTRDPRTAPALAKALNDFENGKNDDDVRYACQSITGMAKAGKLTDQAVIDALWNVFSKFQLSKATSERLYKDLHDAVLAVKSPSYAPKAIEKLAAPVKPDSVESQKDQIMWWQLTSVQILSELKSPDAVKPLVHVLLTPTKRDLNAPTRMALLRMPKESEQVLIGVLNGTDPDFKKYAEGDKDKVYLALVADTLGLISRPGGRDALVAALPNADTDTTRTTFAQALAQFPPDPKLVPAFTAAYNKIPANASVELLGALKPRMALAQASAHFYDSSLTDWLIKEAAAGTDAQGKMLPLDSAFKLMTKAQKDAVGAAVDKAAPEIKKVQDGEKVFAATKQMYDFASKALDECNTDAACFVKILDEPISTSPPTANTRAIKAAWMSVIHGGGANAATTRAALVQKLDKVKDMSARLAVVEAIDALAPQGDTAAADALDKIVEADKAAGDKNLLVSDDAVVKVALRLRARAK